MEWERPSERVRELIRHGAELVLNAQSEWLEELDQATLSAANVQELVDDPVLNAATRRSTRANLLHWAAANVSDPGAPVPANLGPEPLAIARDLVRRGLGESALQLYRVGQNVAWQRWMAIAFALTSDRDELRELLDVSARSLFGFVDATLAGIAEQIQIERDELTRGIARGAARSRRADPRRSADQQTASRSAARIQTRTDPYRRGGLGRRAERRFQPAGARHGGIGTRLADASAPTKRHRERGHPLGLDTRQGRTSTIRRLAAGRWTRCPGFASPSGRPPAASRDSAAATSTRSPRSAMLARLNSTQRVAGFGERRARDRWSPRTPIGPSSSSSRRLAELATAGPDLRAAVLTFVNEQCNASRAAATAVYPPKHFATAHFPCRRIATPTAQREQRAGRRCAGHGSLERQQRRLRPIKAQGYCVA